MENNKLRNYELAGDVLLLFQNANTVRHTTGVTNSLRMGNIRESMQSDEFVVRTCECDETESCELCDNGGIEPCSMESCFNDMRKRSPFDNVANLLTTVKKYEFISLAENAYAQIGNKPFKLVANKTTGITDEEQTEIAQFLYDYIDSFLTTNEVKIDELDVAFNLNTLQDITNALAEEVQMNAENRINESLSRNEEIIERIFKRTDFMKEYLEVLKDTTEYPLGVMWIDDHKVVKTRKVVKGKMKMVHSVQCETNRIDPAYFWATSDWKLNQPGRAVFRLGEFTAGDIRRWKEFNVAGSETLNENIDAFLNDHPSSYRMYEAMLFEDHCVLKEGLYDVLICRGKFNKSAVEELGVTIPDLYEHDDIIPIECYYAGSQILKVRVMEYANDDLGVFTTLFRRSNNSIWGYSLHEFIYPFARMYQGTIKSLDDSVGKSVASIVQVDLGVMDDPDNYIKRDKDTGEVVLDLTDDLLVEFNSSKSFTSPNFKGVPITVDGYPSQLNEIIPVIDVIFRNLEIITGIPSMLVNGSNVSSALRTNSNFNAAFSASAKVVKSLLRESERRVLEPAIRHVFDLMAMSGEMKDFLIEVEPEILLSDTLTRERNDDQLLLQGVQLLSQFNGMIPPERMGQLVNTLAREVYGIERDLVPDVGVMSTKPQTEQVAEI